MWRDREWEYIEEVGREGLSCRGGRKIKRKGWGREREKEDRQTDRHRQMDMVQYEYAWNSSIWEAEVGELRLRPVWNYIERTYLQKEIYTRGTVSAS